MSPSSVCTRTRTGACAAGRAMATREATAAAARIVAIARVGRDSTPLGRADWRRRSEAIDRSELELPPRICTARRLAVIRVADDADVPVGRVVLVVEHVEHVGSDLHAVLAWQSERARQRQVDVSDGS